MLESGHQKSVTSFLNSPSPRVSSVKERLGEQLKVGLIVVLGASRPAIGIKLKKTHFALKSGKNEQKY